MKKIKLLSFITVLLVLCSCFTACGKKEADIIIVDPDSSSEYEIADDTQDEGEDEAHSESGETTVISDCGDDITFRTAATVDMDDAVYVTLSGTSASADGKGISVHNGVITISKKGTYVFSGTLDDGRIIVEAADDDKVVIVLNGADITCSYGSPIFVYNADKTTIHVMGGTENTLSDGTSYTFNDSLSNAEKDEPNACIYSKDDLVIQGSGTLNVNANYNSGIICKDDLKIYDATITINAVNNGINGKDSLIMDSVTLTVNAEGDGIRSTNDTDEGKGTIEITQCVLNIVSGNDGIQAENDVTLNSGLIYVTTAGGSNKTISSDESAKGIKSSSASINILGGTIVFNTCDDSVHAAGAVNIDGGEISIDSGDDAVHSDTDLTINDGTITITSCYEGLEGETITVNGGDISIISSDDGMNVAGGVDSSGFGGFGGGGWSASSSDACITITGGTIYILAGGDGFDSNGTASMSGGTLTVYSYGNADGAIDYQTSFTVTGGTLFAADCGSMASAPSDVSQCTVFLNLGGYISSGNYIGITEGGETRVYYTPISISTIVFSDSSLTQGNELSLSYGGTYSGTCTNGICSGGELSGATDAGSITLSSILTTSGSSYGGMGGGMGGQGGGMGGQGGGTGGHGGRP